MLAQILAIHAAAARRPSHAALALAVRAGEQQHKHGQADEDPGLAGVPRLRGEQPQGRRHPRVRHDPRAHAAPGDAARPA